MQTKTIRTWIPKHLQLEQFSECCIFLCCIFWQNCKGADIFGHDCIYIYINKTCYFDIKEIVCAMQQLSSNMAPDFDCIQMELLSPVPSADIKVICQKVWETRKWSKDWKRSVFTSISKKGDARNCRNYRSIALIPQISKILKKSFCNVYSKS